MEENFFITEKYKPNLKTETIDDDKKKYWTPERISQSYYTRYTLFKFCRKFVKKLHINNLLDIGCGSAKSLMQFIYPVCKEIYGIDQKHIITYVKKHYQSDKFFADNIENSTLNLNKEFDLIISFDVIEHLLNPNTLINYIKRFINENSFIIITTPEREALRGDYCYHSPKKAHIREWNKKEFNNYLQSQGLKILAHTVGYNFNIFPNFKNPLKIIKKDIISLLYKMSRFNQLNKIRHCQMVLCTFNKNVQENKNLQLMTKKFNDLGSIKIFDIFRILTIWIYLSLFKIYQLFLFLKRSVYSISK